MIKVERQRIKRRLNECLDRKDYLKAQLDFVTMDIEDCYVALEELEGSEDQVSESIVE